MSELHLLLETLVVEIMLYLGYLGDAVFAISGALMAARHRMDLIGFMLLGCITGMGGGTLRDMALDRPVFWIADPLELMICLAAAIGVYVLLGLRRDLAEGRLFVWADAVGLSAFAVHGAQIALANGAHTLSALFLGVLSAVGGGLLRDLIAGERPFILSGELYASAALAGAAMYLGLLHLAGLHEAGAALIGFMTVLGLRGLSILTGLRLGAPGDGWIRFGLR